MELVDTKYFDVVIEAGVAKVKIEAGPLKGLIELPLSVLIDAAVKATDNTMDDAIAEIVKKALA